MAPPETEKKSQRTHGEIWGWADDGSDNLETQVEPVEANLEESPLYESQDGGGNGHVEFPPEEVDEFADEPEEKGEVDFWLGHDPEDIHEFPLAEPGLNEGDEEESENGDEAFAPPIDGASAFDYTKPPTDVQLNEIAVAGGGSLLAAKLWWKRRQQKVEPEPVPKPEKVVKDARPRKRPEDYQVPKISWLSQKQRGAKVWGYGFIMAIMITILGSITLATYLVLLNSKVSIPTIVVNVSIVSLLFFLLLLVFRYVALIYMSFLHMNRSKQDDDFEVPKKPIRASILIPAYNEAMGIEASVRSMLELDYEDFEVIIINDGSKDDTLEVARKLEGWHGKVEVRVISQRNLGKANALNYGASMATGEVVVCVDGDSRLHPASLKMGMRHFVDPTISAVAGNVKVVNRRNMLTYLQALEYIEGLNLVRRAQALIQAVNIVPGPMGFFRRSVIMEIGGWDDDTFAEDCDLTLKVLTKRHKIEYEPGAISYTEAPEDLIQLLKQRYRWTRGILQSLRKHSLFLINPAAGWRVMLTLWQMVFESIMWPLMNVTANLLFLLVALLFSMSPLIVFWWVQLTMLDTLAAMHTIAMEKESIKLVPFAIIYRAVFIQLVDVAKLIATFEELLGVEMSWGHIERQGRL